MRSVNLRWPATLLVAILSFAFCVVDCFADTPKSAKPSSGKSAPAAANVQQDAWRKTVKDLVGQANDKLKTGETGAARQLLEQALGQLKEKSGEEDILHADCLLTDGRIQVLEGNKGLADDSFRQALEIKRKLLKGNDKAVIDLIDEYAGLLDSMGRKADAEKLREEAAVAKAKDRANSLAAPTTGAKASTCDKAIALARDTSAGGDRSAALAQWKLALEAAEKQGANDPRVAYCLIKISDECSLKKDYGQAEENLKKAVEVLKSGPKSNSLCTGMAFRRLGVIDLTNKNYARAIDYYGRSLESQTKANADPRMIASTASQLASTCMLARDLSRGEQVCRQLQEISDQLTGSYKAYAKMTATSLLGGIYMQTGRMSEGMALMKQISTNQSAYANLGAEMADAEKAADELMYREVQPK